MSAHGKRQLGQFKFGFVTHKRKKTIELLKKHWKVSLTQIENSVVLEK